MKKQNKKVMKKAIKKAKKNKFVVFLFVIVVIGILVLGGMSYVKLSKVSKGLASIDTKFDSIPTKVSEPIDFFIPEVSGASFSWTYDKNYFPSENEIKQPTYLEGNKKTTITLNMEMKLNVVDKIVDKLLKIGLDGKNWTKEITILALPATDEDIVNEYLSSFNIPGNVYKDLTLRTSSIQVEGLTISWESNNPTVITNNGVIVGNGSAKLTANITLNGVTKTKEFTVEVKDIEDIVVCDYDFSDYSDSTYTNTDNYLEIEMRGTKSQDGAVITRSKSDGSEQGIILTKEIKEVKSIEFSYSYYGSSIRNSYTKNSYIEFFISYDNENYSSIQQETLNDSNIHIFRCDLDSPGGYLKVVVSTEYSESFIAIDDLVITRGFISSDVEEALIKELPTKLTESSVKGSILPFSISKISSKIGKEEPKSPLISKRAVNNKFLIE